MNDTRLFAFESDFVATLRCVPMAVRFKLDHCRIKLSLRQWSRFTPAEREQLLLAPCEAPREVAAYRKTLAELIAARADGRVRRSRTRRRRCGRSRARPRRRCATSPVRSRCGRPPTPTGDA